MENPQDSYFDKIVVKAIFEEDLTVFVSNTLPESITKAIIASLSSHHSPALPALKLDKESQRGRNL